MGTTTTSAMEKATLVKPPGEVQPCESQLTLYELPMSPFSRIARFALAEKALEYRTVILDGMKGDVMEPEYVEKVNAKMLAPVLKVDDDDDDVLGESAHAMTHQTSGRIML